MPSVYFLNREKKEEKIPVSFLFFKLTRGLSLKVSFIFCDEGLCLFLLESLTFLEIVFCSGLT